MDIPWILIHKHPFLRPRTVYEHTNVTAIVYEAFKKAELSCSSPWVLDFATNLPGTNITFHLLMTILASICCASVIVICVYLNHMHMSNWTRPKEQKQIVRIIWLLPIYSTLALLSIWYYHLAGYLAPRGQWAGVFALTALFLLYVEIASPRGRTREEFFHNLERRWFSGRKKGDKGSLRWPGGLNVMVFQLFFTRIATVMATEVLFGISCPLSASRRYGQTATALIQGVSTGIALWGCILLERRFHPKMEEHSALLKLLSFKAVNGLDALQVLLFPTLANNGIFKPSPPFYVSWSDFAHALPNFLLVIELLLCAFTFLWAFDANHYRKQPQHHIIGATRAVRDVLDISDMWAGVAYAFWGRIPSSWSEESFDYSDEPNANVKGVE